MSAPDAGQNVDPSEVSRRARLDQYRAESEDPAHPPDRPLPTRPRGRTWQIDETTDSNSVSASVIDPGDPLPLPLSNMLTRFAEVLTCALSRLAKEND